MSNMSVEDEIEALHKALEAGKKDLTTAQAIGSNMEVKELKELSDKYLTDKAKRDVSKVSRQLTAMEKDGQVYTALYLAVQVRNGNEDKGVRVISDVINELSKDGFIHSCLSPISSLALVRMPLVTQSSVVFSFVLVPGGENDRLMKKYKEVSVEEGELGKPIEDLSPKLEEGEFLAEVTVTQILGMVGGPGKVKELIQQEIDQYLAILPKGTVVREVVDCAVTGLFIPAEVKFYNPIMSDIKQVNLDWVRHGAMIDEKYKECNLITGIRYTRRNGRELLGRDNIKLSENEANGEE